MLKKSLVIFIICINLFGFTSFADDETEYITDQQIKEQNALVATDKNIYIAQTAYDIAKRDAEAASDKILEDNKAELADAQKEVDDAQKVVDADQAALDELGADASPIEISARQASLAESTALVEAKQTASDDMNREVISQMQDALSQSDDEYHDLNVVKLASESLKAQNEAAAALKAKAQANRDALSDDATESEIAAADAELDAMSALEESTATAYSASDQSAGDITDSGFSISVDGLTPGMTIAGKGGNVKERINYLLATVIQKMMIFLGSAALLVMTIGAGYIILHHGQDELLSKGKSIFMSGVYALLVALSSYYIVNIFRFILYQGNV